MKKSVPEAKEVQEDRELLSISFIFNMDGQCVGASVEKAMKDTFCFWHISVHLLPIFIPFFFSSFVTPGRLS